MIETTGDQSVQNAYRHFLGVAARLDEAAGGNIAKHVKGIKDILNLIRNTTDDDSRSLIAWRGR